MITFKREAGERETEKETETETERLKAFNL